jgi:predicted HicB family RNase H-like nuclease
MNYKGYIGVVEFDEDAGIFHGEVINTRDVITFQGTSVEELRQAYIDSIEDYLEFCKVRGEEPEKPFKGNLGLRMSPRVHREAFVRAKQMGISLNEWINQAIEKHLSV